MEIIFLGTNGWYDSGTGNTLCILIVTRQYNILLDAGSGLAKADRYIDQSKETFIFLSHYHLDHVTGLHVLSKFRFAHPLTFLVGKGTTVDLTRFVASPYTIPMMKLPFETRIMELPDMLNELPFPGKVYPLVHADPTIGLRLVLEGRTIAYCPDTGYCSNCVELARDAELLIAECAFRPGESSEMWPHLAPETAARIAREAGVQKMILTHFDAERYRTIACREEARAAARLIFPETEISLDGRRFQLEDWISGTDASA